MTSLTLKNIPDALYQRLKEAAALHRRSLNNEAIVCLEAVLSSGPASPDEQLARARTLRAQLSSTAFAADDIDTFKRDARP